MKIRKLLPIAIVLASGVTGYFIFSYYKSEDYLVGQLASNSKERAQKAASRLKERGSEALKALLKGLKHEKADVRRVITQLLSLLRDASIIQPILQQLVVENDLKVREELMMTALILRKTFPKAAEDIDAVILDSLLRKNMSENYWQKAIMFYLAQDRKKIAATLRSIVTRKDLPARLTEFAREKLIYIPKLRPRPVKLSRFRVLSIPGYEMKVMRFFGVEGVNFISPVGAKGAVIAAMRHPLRGARNLQTFMRDRKAAWKKSSMKVKLLLEKKRKLGGLDWVVLQTEDSLFDREGNPRGRVYRHEMFAIEGKYYFHLQLHSESAEAFRRAQPLYARMVKSFKRRHPDDDD